MRSKLLLVATVVLAALGALLINQRFAAAATGSGAKIGAAAPIFSLPDENGKSVSLDDYKGKVVVLEWVNPECPFVQRHYRAKTMTTLATKYAPQDVVWLAINSTNHATAAQMQSFVKRNSISYPILMDTDGTVGHEFNAKTTPDMFIIDKSGNLVYDGGIDNDPDGNRSDRINYVAKALDEVLAGKSVTTPETKSYGCGVKY